MTDRAGQRLACDLIIGANTKVGRTQTYPVFRRLKRLAVRDELVTNRGCPTQAATKSAAVFVPQQRR